MSMGKLEVLRVRRSVLFKLASTFFVLATVAATMGQYSGPKLWWEAGDTENLPLSASFPDRTGELLLYNYDGPVAARHNSFFQPLGTNGRACVTCHQPSNAMSLSADTLQERWKETEGKDPVFAAIDGSNCPTLPQSQKSSHSLLLQRGLFRIYLPWPTVDSSGTPIKPEFTIEVVRDPTGCNTDPVYGLNSAHPTISVYRRPRMVANLKFVLGTMDGFDMATSKRPAALSTVERSPQTAGKRPSSRRPLTQYLPMNRANESQTPTSFRTSSTSSARYSLLRGLTKLVAISLRLTGHRLSEPGISPALNWRLP